MESNPKGMKKVFIYIDARCTIEILQKFIAKSGFDFKVEDVKDVTRSKRSINADEEAEVITETFEFPEDKSEISYLTPTDIIKLIKEKTGRNLDLKLVGSALNQLGFKKTCQRIDGVPKGVYAVKIRMTREEKFKSAQEIDFKYDGVIAARDYDNPDDFNNACKKYEDERRSKS